MLEHLPLVDLRAASAPGSLMRAISLEQSGRYRIARRNAELYSVQILCAGTWGRLDVYNGRGRKLFPMPSMFPGSFWLSAGADDGIIVEMFSRGASPMININWREKDAQLV